MDIVASALKKIKKNGNFELFNYINKLIIPEKTLEETATQREVDVLDILFHFKVKIEKHNFNRLIINHPLIQLYLNNDIETTTYLYFVVNNGYCSTDREDIIEKAMKIKKFEHVLINGKLLSVDKKYEKKKEIVSKYKKSFE